MSRSTIWGLTARAHDEVAPFAVTAERFEDIPTALAGLIDTVVAVAPLRDRPEDVLPLAAHIAIIRVVSGGAAPTMAPPKWPMRRANSA